MGFYYNKYKEAQYSSPVKQKSTVAKVWTGTKWAGKKVLSGPIGAAWLAYDVGKGLYDFDFLGFKSHMNRPKGSGSGGSWKPETKKEKEKRESKEGKVVKGGTQRFLGTVD